VLHAFPPDRSIVICFLVSYHRIWRAILSPLSCQISFSSYSISEWDYHVIALEQYSGRTCPVHVFHICPQFMISCIRGRPVVKETAIPFVHCANICGTKDPKIALSIRSVSALHRLIEAALLTEQRNCALVYLDFVMMMHSSRMLLQNNDAN